jgi:hypothetical protein
VHSTPTQPAHSGRRSCAERRRIESTTTFVVDGFESGALTGWQAAAVGRGAGGWFLYTDGEGARSPERPELSSFSPGSSPRQARGRNRHERSRDAHFYRDVRVMVDSSQNGELRVFLRLGYVVVSLSNLDPPAAS